MKAVLCTKYGSPDVLKLQEVTKPTPKDHEVLVRVYATTVTAADCMMRKGEPKFGRLFLGLKRPKKPIPGTGVAGEVEAVGKDVKLFKTGDKVFGETLVGFSANAEYVCMPEDGVLTTIPANLTYEEASPVCDGALTALNFLRDKANIQNGQRVLIIGASGGVGTSAIQIAKYFGAEVTGICSTENIEMVKSLGADRVIDYTKEDFTLNGQTYHIIFDTVGKNSFSRCKGSLTENGTYLSPVLGFPLLFHMLWTSKIGSKQAMFSATGFRPATELRILLQELKELLEDGKIKTVIDRCYPLEHIVEAHHYVEKGHKKGNVVITLKNKD